MNWYSFIPLDTLYFRGAESMEIGVNHTASTIFPPNTSTIIGAIKTTVLIQNKINFNNYCSKDFNDLKIIDDIGKFDERNKFEVVGPIFYKQEYKKIFIPAPYSWFIEDTKINEFDHGTYKIYKLREIYETEKQYFITSNKINYCLDDVKANLKTIGGRFWIEYNEDSFKESRIKLYKNNYFYTYENRTGIAIDYSSGRKTREHHLYTFNHIRLKNNFTLLFGINKDISLLWNNGTLLLGAEQRLGIYKKESGINICNNLKKDFYMTLGNVEICENDLSFLVITGKLKHIGGWDYAKNFHKPMKTFFPAGTVTNKKLSSSFIEI